MKLIIAVALVVVLVAACETAEERALDANRAASVAVDKALTALGEYREALISGNAAEIAATQEKYTAAEAAAIAASEVAAEAAAEAASSTR